MFGLGVGEILVILVAALIFIGPKKLPELAKTLGKGLREFQNATRGITQTIQNPMDQQNHNQHTNLDQPSMGRESFNEQFKDDPPHDQRPQEDDQSQNEPKIEKKD